MPEVVFSVTTIRNQADFQEWQQQQRKTPLYSAEDLDKATTRLAAAINVINERYLLSHYEWFERWLTSEINVYTQVSEMPEWVRSRVLRHVVEDMQLKRGEVRAQMKKLSHALER